MKKMLPNYTFYDELAFDYDDMISFDRAVKNKKKQFENFLISEMNSTADIGCGSGADSIALFSSGLKVTAFDPSSEMLKNAEANSKRMNVKVEFQNYAADIIPKEFDEKFDLVVSLGNTFANIPKGKFLNSLQRCYKILRTKGQLLIQVLNYEKILVDKQRIVNITEKADKCFIRFYDFLDGDIIFNILTFSKVKPSDNKLISTKIYPHSVKNFESGLKRAGFKSIQFYSNLELSAFDKERSKDLVIRAIKTSLK